MTTVGLEHHAAVGWVEPSMEKDSAAVAAAVG